MTTKTLSIERREKTGTTSAHALRSEGKVPAVIYGHGTQPLHVAFDERAFADALHHGGRTAILTLSLGDSPNETVLVRDLQRDPISNRILHAELQRISEHESVHARLPIVTAGVARGVKDFAGVMDVLLHEIEVEGPADALPQHIEVDVTPLGIHEHARAGDIALPSGLKLLTPADTVIVAIEASKTARQLEEAAFEQSEPEVIGQKPETTTPE
ncbi:MAG: 50S ribosomal protein L25 [Vulcanimicrobiaceae bacterium]